VRDSCAITRGHLGTGDLAEIVNEASGLDVQGFAVGSFAWVMRIFERRNQLQTPA